jgi:hypothetical protein
MTATPFLSVMALATGLLLCSCGSGSNPSTSSSGASTGTTQVRFIEGAPELEALVQGVPTDIGLAYLTVNNATIASSFPYAAITPFSSFPAGTLSLTALDSLGYAVGPIKTSSALESGKRYTVVLLGTYPNYRAIAYQEPDASSSAGLSVYEASPAAPSVDFGKFVASSQSGFQRLGSVAFGNLVSVPLGKSVSNFGGYAGKGTTPFPNGAVTLEDANSFDVRNVLPFHTATRLSLFIIDPKSGSSAGPVLGVLDQ